MRLAHGSIPLTKCAPYLSVLEIVLNLLDIPPLLVGNCSTRNENDNIIVFVPCTCELNTGDKT